MSLFQFGDFTLHSGERSEFKIDCDALTPDDWAAVAAQLIPLLPAFEEVIGIPRGGLALAEALRPYACVNDHPGRPDPLLIVDDVYTTGSSIKKEVAKHHPRHTIAAVLFARTPPPWWVVPLFRMERP